MALADAFLVLRRDLVFVFLGSVCCFISFELVCMSVLIQFVLFSDPMSRRSSLVEFEGVMFSRHRS